MLAKHDVELADNVERIKVMKEHLRNVKQEITHAQQLHKTRQQEVKTEQHMRQMVNENKAVWFGILVMFISKWTRRKIISTPFKALHWWATTSWKSSAKR